MAELKKPVVNSVADMQLVMEFYDTAGNTATITIKHPKANIYLETAQAQMQAIINSGIVLSAKGLPLDVIANVYYYQKEKEYIISPTEMLKKKFEKM